MKQMIMLKLGEIVLKGLNRRVFEDRLMKNVNQAIGRFGRYHLKKAQSIIYVLPEDGFDMEGALEALQKVFGIATIVTAAETEKNMDSIKKTASDYLAETLMGVKTFKCEAKRSDKTFPLRSPQINEEMGEYLLEQFPHLTVNVKNPDVIVYTEIRDFGAYVHAGKLQGAGGMPVGSNGKATILLSGGIDSPVAGYMVAKRGVQLEAVHFYSHPYTSERAKEKVISLAKILAEYAGTFKLHIVHFTQPQLDIYQNCPDEELTIIMRRVMMKIAERIAVDNGSLALVTGESIGQVASQTLESLGVTDESTFLPVIRPVIGMDKEEIVSIARRIGTFETSILPYEDCCTVFVPKHPKTKPKLERIKESEKVLDMEAIIETCVATQEVLVIGKD